MCDTLFIRSNGIGWFAKNSDREPDEPQALVWLPAVAADKAASVRATYTDVAQQARRYGVLLSQPSWIWGGEIGVNTQGVAIGNEAVFSKLVPRQGTALLGMDLLRLGLERGGSAREALDVIVWHLERYGQAGPAGYRDKAFRYDNSYLIADPSEAWVLETAGRLWVARKVQAWAISNCYSLGTEFDLCSQGLQDEAKRLRLWNGRGDFDFAKAFDTRLYAFVGGAQRRRALNGAAIACGLEPGWAAMAARLRDHGQRGDDFSSHDNRQICLHAGSFLRPSQTTASLIARLAPGQAVRVAATGTSAPCLSLFEPMQLPAPGPGTAVVSSGSRVTDSPWAQFEPVHHRALFDRDFRRQLRTQRDTLEAELFAAASADAPDWQAVAQRARSWRQQWAARADASPYRAPGRLGAWWRKQALRELAQAQASFYP
jgi:dipeptidase